MKTHTTNLLPGRTLYLILLAMLVWLPQTFLRAQSTTLNTTAVTGWSNNNGSGTVTFNFQNTNPYPVIITSVEGIVGTAGVTSADLWIKTTPVNGSPGNISTANGWTQMATGTFTGVANATITNLTTQPFLTGISVTIPAGVTYGMAVTAYSGTAGRQRYHTMVAPNIPLTTVSGGGCNILMGTNISYGGGAPPATPGNSPRGWIGKLTFEPAAPCTSPPTPGTAIATSTFVCNGQPTILSLSGLSGGTGQTYAWESSSTSGGPFTPIPGATSVSYTVNPVSTTYYRCQVTCSGNTQASAEVMITVAASFPGGSYTINNNLPTGGTNFASFSAAVAAISCGISGPVIFDVDPGSGPYTEQITLPTTIGSDAIKTVTFNGNGRTLQFNSTDANNRHVIKIDGADYITFNELNIVASAGTYGWGVHFINGADYNTFNLCNITTSISSTVTADFACVVMSNSVTSSTTAGNTGNYNVFLDNTFIGGGYNVTLCGNAIGSEAIGNTFTNNQFRDAYSYALYMINQKNDVISMCDFSRPNRAASTTTAGVFMTTGCTGNLIENNRIHDFFQALPTNTSTFYGIYCAGDAAAADPNRLINNVVYGNEGNGAQYGIYTVGADHLRIFHNTLSLDDQGATTGATYGIYQTTLATGINIFNNMITISRSGSGLKTCLHFNTTTSTITSNNNNLFLNSTGTGVQSVGFFNALNYATLANWQTANGGIYDGNSISANPAYFAPVSGNFTPTSFLTNNVGINVGVGFDINGNPRSVSTPDPGAYEYDLVGLDAAIAWVAPVSPVTPGVNNVTVSITNNLSTVINTLQLSYTDGTNTYSEVFNGLNILPTASQNFTFATSINITGNLVMRAFINSVNGVMDDAQGNDTTGFINVCLGMSGAYTLNAGAPASLSNFQSFSALAAALACGGITGPVTVDVLAGTGPYVEQASFDPIPGASAINTITINGNNNILTSPGGANYFTLRINGADYMSWNNMNIASTGTTNAIALNLANISNFNTFTNCQFSVPLTLTSTTTSAVAFSSSPISATGLGNNGNNNTFSNCTMTGGYYCVSVYGNSTTGGNISGNQFLNCTIREFYLYGMYMAYNTTTIVRDCIFERPARTTVTTTYGIYQTTNTNGSLIERNRFRNFFGGALTSTSTAYAIYCLSTSTVGNENKLINNLIHNIQGNGTQAGIYLSSPTNIQVFHNTISLDYTAATAGTTYGIYNSGVTNVNIQNNIVTVSRGGTGTKHCLYYASLPTTTNYNNVFMNSAAGTNYIAYDGITNFATLVAYQAAQLTKDQQSVNLDPQYISPASGDYKPFNFALDNLGNTTLGVLTDIMGVTRAATPDIGAYEFEIYPTDIGVVSLNAPNNSGCYTGTETITVTIRNLGFNTLDFSTTPATVNCSVSGPISGTTSATVNTGTLAPLATMTVTLSPGVDMTANGTYTLSCSATMVGDGNTGNDALSPAPSRIVGPVGGTITASPATICVSGIPTLSISGHYGGAIQWQESVSDAGPWTNVGAGANSYVPAVPITSTMYYRAEILCNGNSAFSNTFTVTVNNPSIVSTNPGVRCGTGTVNLSVVPSAGASTRWFANLVGGAPLATGNNFTTPTISSTTTYYAEALIGIGGQDSISATTGGTTGVYHHMFVLASSTGLTLQDIGITTNMALGALTSWDVYYRTGNYQTIPGANTSAAGWTLLSSVTNLPSAGPGAYIYITLNQSLVIAPGDSISLYVAPGTGTTHQYNTTALGVVNSTNSNATLIAGNRGSSLFNCSTPGGIPTIRVRYSLGCIGAVRVPVSATVTPPPAINVVVTDPVVCPGGSTTVSVSSANDPNYTYTWTSIPPGFNASGAGPHTVTPASNTQYIVNALDNTLGPNAGCAEVGSVSVIAAPALLPGTVSGNVTTICVSGTPELLLSGNAGGTIQWQESSVSASGPWTNVGGATQTYTPVAPITTTTYYQAVINCPGNSVTSNVYTVTVNNPAIVGTIPGSRCGYGSVTLEATPEPGATVKWYDAPTGGNLLFSGSPFNTPAVGSSTNFYAAAAVGGGGGTASPLQITEVDLGNTDQLEVQNVSPDPLNITGWKVAISNSYTDINSVNPNIQLLSGTLAPGATLTWNDAVGSPNYWGSNMFWNPGAFPSFTGWAAILDNNNVLRDFVVWNWPAANITAASVNIGGPIITVGTQWSGNGIDATIVAATQSLSRQGTTDNHNAADFTIINTSMGTTNPGMTLPFTGFGCEGTRVAVLATVNPAPAVTVSASTTTTCAGDPVVLTATSANDPNYSYTWNPGNLSGYTVTVNPTTTTTYTVLAEDNSAGPNAGCAELATITINVNALPDPFTLTATNTSICEGSSTNISLVAQSPTYCTASHANLTTSGDYCSLVEIAGTTLSNPTLGAAALPNYTLYPPTGNTTATLTAGMTYSLTLSPGTYTINDLAAWMDFNRNGVFEASEKLGETDDMGAAPATTTFVFTVPANTFDGLCRLRVREADQTTIGGMDPCILETWGETEDYDLTIIGGVAQYTYQWSPGSLNGTAVTVSPTSTTVYTVTATNGLGCTLSNTIHITVNTVTSSTTTFSTCITPYIWNGNSYSATGTYTFTSLNAAGCDSTAVLDLTITPCNSTLNLMMYIQGYWDGVSGMQPVLFNQGQSNPITDCDSILVELHDAMTPSTVSYSLTTVLQTNGTASCVFPPVSGSYYIAVKHRNAIETWSANPVVFSSPVTSYNFSTAANQAFGDNQVEVATGVWAFYSGDVVKDLAESTDLLDLAQMEFEISNFSFGYYAEDLTGDGNVDLNDSPILETNILLFISSFHP